MEDKVNDSGAVDVRKVVQEAIREFIQAEQTKAAPAYKAELLEEKRRREQLERRVNELAEENKQSRARAEEAERSSVIRAELQRLGVAKIDLAFKAVKDDVIRYEDGRMAARSADGEIGVREYLTKFVNENPELLPARISGGSGASAGHKTPTESVSVDLDKIRPGMKKEDLDRIRQEVARIAMQSMEGR